MEKKVSEVAVAMSGGVDSAFAAATLKEAGWVVHGIHFALPSTPEGSEAKVRTVRMICDHLHIPFEVLDLRERFNRLVVEPFVSSYLQGMTPNPCVLCNPAVKFDRLIHYADGKGIPFVATGHYARSAEREGGGSYDLLRGEDPGKEQSYFLQRLNQVQLKRTLFPLAGWRKEDVRVLARRMGLPVHSSPESQEICFLPGKDYRVFVEETDRRIRKEGNILDGDGKWLGNHAGAHRYTIGQRHGLGLASSRPYYVMEIRPDTNEVIVGRKEDLFSREVEAEDFSWIEGGPPKEFDHAEAQVRYRHRSAAGRLELLDPRRVRFTFDEPQWAVTPGQALACYRGERLLGGGWIVR